MANRHLSRSIVLQTLFEWDFLPKSPLHGDFSDEEIKKILSRNLKEFAPGLEDDVFVFTLIREILKKRTVIDEIIEKAAPDWPINKISVIDRNILRIGLTELLFGDRKEVPPKVAINEAIELAKTFGGDNSGKFINGVLGAVYKEIGEPGKDEKSKAKKKDEPVDITKLPVENLGGALVYSMSENEIMFGLVHDVFGYWTLSKGRLEAGEDIEEGTKREIKEEIGLDIEIVDKLGENEYVATHPEKGKTLKKVTYFLAKSEYVPLELEVSGGLDGARWFTLKEIPNLHIYNDIIPLIKKAIDILSSKKF
ncbi:transcription antitermination factor NusB [Candidatus Nomurabacteria bacterium]|nr:transcription antitermination factor NusB [Candidatus Nomurabacteria bacterium]